MKQILILGGGAAGMAAAITAAQNAPRGTQVVVLEKNPRVGKKLLATGNGRCNLDHTPVTGADFFTSDTSRLQEMLRAIEGNDPLQWFEAHGLLHRTDEAGRVYPYSNQAADVLNLLLYWLNKTGVEVRTDCTVTALSKTEEGFLAELSDGRIWSGRSSPARRPSPP